MADEMAGKKSDEQKKSANFIMIFELGRKELKHTKSMNFCKALWTVVLHIYTHVCFCVGLNEF